MSRSISVERGCLLFGAAPFGAALVGLATTTIAIIAVPATKRLAGPSVCPTDYVRSVVVQYIGHPKPGTTTFSSEIYCIKASGRPIQATDSQVFFGMWLMIAGSVLIAMLGALVAMGLKRGWRAVR